LASSNPQELFLPHEFQDKKLFQGTLANAWAGACVFYGPPWLPDTVISLDIWKGLNKPSKWWTTLSDEARQNIVPFSSADLFSDASDSMHDLAKHNRVCLSIMDLPSVPESPPAQTDNENHWGN
jgi:hypothetical protein